MLTRSTAAGLLMSTAGAALVGAASGVASAAFLVLLDGATRVRIANPGLPAWTFAAKALLTALTIGAGFIGGEVTPLFVIGATLGNALAPVLGLPLDLAAGVGMAATFAAAANTPLALTVMAVELLGPNALPHTLLVCLLAFVLSGHRGIYPAQRVALSKRLRRHEPPVQLAEVGRGSVPGHPRHDGPTGAPG
jgi:H+/Cl- antiporter ClcA